MEYDITYEQKFLDMLGYSSIPSTENKWTILDDKECPVGFIERKRKFRKNNKRGLPATYEYAMSIESETISYRNARIENSGKLYCYEFHIKDAKDNLHFVSIDCGDNPSISISNGLGLDSISIDYRGLHCTLRSKVKNQNVEEIIIYRDSKADDISNTEYTYQINHCKKDKSLDDISQKGITARVLSATADASQRYSDRITLKLATYRNNKLYPMQYSNEKDMPGTVEEVAIKNGMGIEAVSHLRYRFNEMLPFKEEVFESIFKGNQYLEVAGGHLFFPDIMTGCKNKQIKKV